MQNQGFINDKSAKRDYAFLLIAIITLFNPCVNVIDVFPDFIGCLLICAVIKKACLAAPYFSEARTWLLRASAVSALKIPALFAVVAVRSQNTQDNDIVALVAIVFLTMELICFIPAINNLFSALFYLGERTDAAALIKGNGKTSPEGLKSLTVAFIILRGSLAALPELLRLTRAVELGGTSVIARGSRLYPYAVLAAAAITLAVGTVWLIKAIRYVKAIKAEGKFYEVLNALVEQSSAEEYERKLTLGKKKRAGLLIIFACVFSFEFGLQEYGDVNLIPHTLVGIILLFAIVSLCRLSSVKRCVDIAAKLSCTVYCILSAVTYALSLTFLDRHGYSDLTEGGSIAARKLYQTVTVLSVFEFVAYLATAVFLFLLLVSYIDKNIVNKKGLEPLSTVDKDRRKSLIIRTACFISLFSLVGLGKLLQVIFKGNQLPISTGGSSEHATVIVAQSMPWFTVALAILTAVLVLYSVYYVGMLRDEETV